MALTPEDRTMALLELAFDQLSIAIGWRVESKAQRLYHVKQLVNRAIVALEHIDDPEVEDGA